jgi:NAD(P)-dependent dehydrogenase (short-subunit alcohol dehydrogenase family)
LQNYQKTFLPVEIPTRLPVIHSICFETRCIIKPEKKLDRTMSFTHTVIVTGGTVGLGYYAALNIAKSYPQYLVVLSSRTDRESAAQKINSTLGQDNVTFLPLDLSSVAKVKEYAKEYSSKKFPPIIALLLNAGLQFPNEITFTPDGFESTFQVNHLGHAYLLHHLSPYFAPGVRVTLTASGTHDPAQKSGMPDAVYTSAADIARPNPKTATKDGRQRYSTSKLLNVMFGYALVRRTPSERMTVNSFDPGLMPGTGLAREYSPFLRFIWNHVLPFLIPVLRLMVTNGNIHLPEESGANLAWVALSKDTAGKNGLYYEGRKEIPSSVDSRIVEKQDDLWDWTVNEVTGGKEEYLSPK